MANKKTPHRQRLEQANKAAVQARLDHIATLNPDLELKPNAITHLPKTTTTKAKS